MSTVAMLDYDGAVARYEPVIGLETHAQLTTESKIFSLSATVTPATSRRACHPTRRRAARRYRR